MNSVARSTISRMCFAFCISICITLCWTPVPITGSSPTHIAIFSESYREIKPIRAGLQAISPHSWHFHISGIGFPNGWKERMMRRACLSAGLGGRGAVRGCACKTTNPEPRTLNEGRPRPPGAVGRVGACSESPRYHLRKDTRERRGKREKTPNAELRTKDR